jgi:hypothetical protein
VKELELRVLLSEVPQVKLHPESESAIIYEVKFVIFQLFIYFVYSYLIYISTHPGKLDILVALVAAPLWPGQGRTPSSARYVNTSLGHTSTTDMGPPLGCNKATSHWERRRHVDSEEEGPRATCQKDFGPACTHSWPTDQNKRRARLKHRLEHQEGTQCTSRLGNILLTQSFLSLWMILTNTSP